MSRAGKASQTGESIRCPFSIVIDSAEQQPFAFQGMKGDYKEKYAVLTVETVRCALPVGDYAIAGRIHEYVIERKSKADLYSSMNSEDKRANFIGRLERMNRMGGAAVVIESDWYGIIEEPPPFTQFDPKSVYRTVLAWQQRYPRVHWWACYSRRFAEITTFRLLYRWFIDRPEGRRRGSAATQL